MREKEGEIERLHIHPLKNDRFGNWVVPEARLADATGQLYSPPANSTEVPMRVILRVFGFILALGLTLATPPSEAQQAANVSRIGYLAVNGTADRSQAFRQGLRDFGYVEGRNVVIEYRDAEGRPERLPVLAAELIALKVQVIVAATTVAALAATQATPSVRATMRVPGSTNPARRERATAGCRAGAAGHRFVIMNSPS
jgi:hypothetical protein